MKVTSSFFIFCFFCILQNLKDQVCIDKGFVDLGS